MISTFLLIVSIAMFIIVAALAPAVEPWRSRLAYIGLACLAGAELFSRGLPLLH